MWFNNQPWFWNHSFLRQTLNILPSLPSKVFYWGVMVEDVFTCHLQNAIFTNLCTFIPTYMNWDYLHCSRKHYHANFGGQVGGVRTIIGGARVFCLNVWWSWNRLPARPGSRYIQLGPIIPEHTMNPHNSVSNHGTRESDMYIVVHRYSHINIPLKQRIC